MSGPTQTMGASEADRIVVRGLDLCEQIIGHAATTHVDPSPTS